MNDSIAPVETTDQNGNDSLFGQVLTTAIQTAGNVYQSQNPPAGYAYNPSTQTYIPNTASTIVASSKWLQVTLALGVAAIAIAVVVHA